MGWGFRFSKTKTTDSYKVVYHFARRTVHTLELGWITDTCAKDTAVAALDEGIDVTDWRPEVVWVDSQPVLKMQQPDDTIDVTVIMHRPT